MYKGGCNITEQSSIQFRKFVGFLIAIKTSNEVGVLRPPLVPYYFRVAHTIVIFEAAWAEWIKKTKMFIVKHARLLCSVRLANFHIFVSLRMSE